MLTNSQDALYQRLCHAGETQAPWQYPGALELSSQPQSGDWAPQNHSIAANSVLTTLPPSPLCLYILPYGSHFEQFLLKK